MQNCKTSVGTTAQKSSKCSLLFRPAALAAILMLAVVFSSCQKEEEKIESKIVITKTLVCDTYVFGLVGSGSCLFHYNNSVKGYLVQLKSGENVLNSSYCLPEQLNFIVEKIKYELTQKDSTILLP